MPQRAPVAVLFDLDGTLIDSIQLIILAAQHAFASREGPAPSQAEFIAGIGRPLVAQFGPFALNDDDMQLLTMRYREYQLMHHDRLTTLYDGVMDVVLELHARGHPLAVVTSKMDGIARRSIAHVGLEPYMSVVVACDHTARHKPDPEPVQLALDRLGVPPGRAVFVGDSPYDIQAGNAAGVTSIAATWGAFSHDTLAAASPSYVLERPQGLSDLILRLAGCENDRTLFKPNG
jgi:pyrophosphatase PpaX